MDLEPEVLADDELLEFFAAVQTGFGQTTLDEADEYRSVDQKEKADWVNGNVAKLLREIDDLEQELGLTGRLVTGGHCFG